MRVKRKDIDFRSNDCQEGEHDRGSHLWGHSGSFWKVRVPKSRLCECACLMCRPVAKGDWIPTQTWRTDCSCPGAETARQERP